MSVNGSLLVALLLCGTPAFAAFTATTNWEVRTTGSDSNGGGFDVASGGTDYSQQDAAQVAFTDMVIDGTTNTQFTSVATPCTSALVGNVINVASGTGFTVQRVQVSSCTSTTYNVDKSLGTLSSTGGTGSLGGGLLTIAKAASVIADKNVGHIKAGTYTQTTALNGFGSAAQTWVGYQTTHYDGGTKPLVTTATNSVILWNPPSNGSGAHVLQNLAFSNTASVRADGFRPSSALVGLEVYNCTFDGFQVGINGDNGGSTGALKYVVLVGVEIKNSVSDGARIYNSLSMSNSWIHNNGGHGITFIETLVGNVATCYRSIFSSNTSSGINLPSSGTLFSTNCAFVSNASDGATIANFPKFFAVNTIFYGNGGWGINLGAVSYGSVGRANAYGSNVSGNINNAAVGVGDIALSANPFTNSAGGDFTLNSTAGGGAALKSLGYGGVTATASPGVGTTARPDIGPAQSAIVGGGVGYATIQ